MDACKGQFKHSVKRGFYFGRRICRQFVNGSCRFGQQCSYLHEYSAVPSVQVCRYFQKGGCWFGENCRYLHIAGTDGASPGARRSSAPVVNAITLPGHFSADRRGSEPSFGPELGAYNWRRGSEPLVSTVSCQQASTRQTTDIVEEEDHAGLEAESTVQQQVEMRLREIDEGSLYSLPCSRANESATNGASDQVTMVSKLDKQEENHLLDSGATASVDQGQLDEYYRSKDVICGICMDKVYEKSTTRERRFGILPNCSHAFCLNCIMTWRKTKDFQEEVIKACPQCRVKSPFYIPSKYWVCESDPKEALIASFKEKNSKIKCNFFMRHGCCPFGSECIFSHELSPGHIHHRRGFEFKMFLELLKDMDGEDQGRLFHLIALTHLEDEDFDFIQFELV